MSNSVHLNPKLNSVRNEFSEPQLMAKWNDKILTWHNSKLKKDSILENVCGRLSFLAVPILCAVDGCIGIVAFPVKAVVWIVFKPIKGDNLPLTFKGVMLSAWKVLVVVPLMPVFTGLMLLKPDWSASCYFFATLQKRSKDSPTLNVLAVIKQQTVPGKVSLSPKAASTTPSISQNENTDSEPAAEPKDDSSIPSAPPVPVFASNNGTSKAKGTKQNLNTIASDESSEKKSKPKTEQPDAKMGNFAGHFHAIAGAADEKAKKLGLDEVHVPEKYQPSVVVDAPKYSDQDWEDGDTDQWKYASMPSFGSVLAPNSKNEKHSKSNNQAVQQPSAIFGVKLRATINGNPRISEKSQSTNVNVSSSRDLLSSVKTTKVTVNGDDNTSTSTSNPETLSVKAKTALFQAKVS